MVIALKESRGQWEEAKLAKVEILDTSTLIQCREGEESRKRTAVFSEEVVFSRQTQRNCKGPRALSTSWWQISDSPIKNAVKCLENNELPSVKSSKNVLSLENHYSVMQEQSLLQGQACITCEEVWESSLPVLSYFFSQLSPSITSWQQGTHGKAGKLPLPRSLPSKEKQKSV